MALTHPSCSAFVAAAAPPILRKPASFSSSSPRFCRRRRPSSPRTLALMDMSSTSTSRRLELIRLPSREKVYEDGSTGIVCYRDEDGEITCEGIDEGPRFCRPPTPILASNQREAEIIDLLRTSLIQMGEGSFRFLN